MKSSRSEQDRPEKPLCARGPGWEHFEHASDIGVRGFGADPASAFANAALALTAIITPPDLVAQIAAVDIERSDKDLEILFVDWLNAVLFEMAARRMLFSRFEARIDGPRLRARAWGEPLDAARHRPAIEVKAATYCGLAVREEAPGRWVAQCVVDV